MKMLTELMSLLTVRINKSRMQIGKCLKKKHKKTDNCYIGLINISIMILVLKTLCKLCGWLVAPS